MKFITSDDIYNMALKHKALTVTELFICFSFIKENIFNKITYDVCDLNKICIDPFERMVECYADKHNIKDKIHITFIPIK